MARNESELDPAARGDDGDGLRRNRREIPAIADELVRSCCEGGGFDHIEHEPLPSKERTIAILGLAFEILYPGYFSRERVDRVNLPYVLGLRSAELFEALAGQVRLAFRHECRRLGRPCERDERCAAGIALDFMRGLPGLRAALAKDIRAAYEGDPAAGSPDEVIFSYPGLYAVTVHRIAHALRGLGVALIPRIMAEHAHGVTGIDIHPGAEIGESFFIDHGTGVVIGETARIGDRVRIYQGVTLGALSLPKDEVERLRGERRHPTIGDDVVIYANVTILGGDTVVGARSVIGGSVWLTESVPPDTRVFLKKPELVMRGPS